MKTRTQKLISLVLVLMMLVTMVPAGIFTASAEDDAIVIETLDQWNAYAETGTETFAGKTVKLGDNITGITKPLAANFAGTFDGDGYAIYDVTFEGAGVIAAKLSGSAIVKNVKFENVDITGTGNTGLIAGAVTVSGENKITIEKINVDANSSVSGAAATGGLIGHATLSNSATLAFDSIDAAAAVSGSGLVGKTNQKEAKSIGGILGYGLVSTTTAAGATAPLFSANACLVMGTVSATGTPDTANNIYMPPVSGVFGILEGGGYNSHKRISVTNCFIGAKMTTTGPNKSCLIAAYDEGGNFTYSNVKSITGATYNQYGGGNNGSTVNGETPPATYWGATHMKDIATVSLEDAQAFFTRNDKNFISIKTIDNYDTIETFEIDSAAKWNELARSVHNFEGKKVVLTKDFDANDEELTTFANVFKGTFDGNNKTISNAIVNGNGVIANILEGGATVQNVKFVNVDVTGTGAVGMIAGTLAPANTTTITKISIDDTSSVTGTTQTGGLIGIVNTANTYTLAVSNLSMKAEVAGGTTGGVVGKVGNNTNATSQAYVNISNAIISPAAKVQGGAVGDFLGARPAANTASTTASRLSLTNVAMLGSNYTYFISNTSNNVSNVAYTNMYVTSTSIGFLYSGSYATYINGIHCKDATSVDRYSPTVVNIVDKGTIEIPWLIDDSDVNTYFSEDENGYVIYGYDPSLIPDYATTNTFEIANIDDWNALAGKDHTFAGKKIVLTKDIDATGVTLLPLATYFAGDFDGQGHTITGATVNGAGLIADTLLGGGVIQKVSFDGVTVNNQSGNAGILAGSLIADRGAKINITQINVTNSSVTGTGYAGGLIGSIKVTESKTSGVIDVSKIYSQVTVTSSANNTAVGGLIGYAEVKGTSRDVSVTLNLEDAIVDSKLSGGNKRAGVVGYFLGDAAIPANGGSTDINNTKNNITTYFNMKDLVVKTQGFTYRVAETKYGAFTCENLYLVGAKDTDNIFRLEGYASWLNQIHPSLLGKDGNRDFITTASIAASGKMDVPFILNTVATSEDVAKMAMNLSDKEGFLRLVPQQFQVVGLQQSASFTTDYALRFIAPMYLENASDIKMTVVAAYTNADGKAVTKTFEAETTMYDGLTAYDEYKITEKDLIRASDYGANKLAGFTIYGIPVGMYDITFEATVTYTVGETTVTSVPVTVMFNIDGALAK
ncbi:MAG: hypothetical protein J6Q82_02745 [Clostridia bacterium]|nr:hypothetical protein [Clostridia bacterium]